MARAKAFHQKWLGVGASESEGALKGGGRGKSEPVVTERCLSVHRTNREGVAAESRFG